jgi:hypothetical protein
MATLLEGEVAAHLAVHDQVLQRLHAMSEAQRLRCYRDGGLTHHERALWAAHFPDEVPLVNGELEWIALALADLD